MSAYHEESSVQTDRPLWGTQHVQQEDSMRVEEWVDLGLRIAHGSIGAWAQELRAHQRRKFAGVGRQFGQGLIERPGALEEYRKQEPRTTGKPNHP